jgi:hypothetical protein
MLRVHSRGSEKLGLPAELKSGSSELRQTTIRIRQNDKTLQAAIPGGNKGDRTHYSLFAQDSLFAQARLQLAIEKHLPSSGRRVPKDNVPWWRYSTGGGTVYSM